MAFGCNDLPEDKARLLMAEPKQCAPILKWDERGNHKGLFFATAQLDDDTGTTLPGVTMKLEIKRAIIADRCLYEFGMWKLERGVPYRVYQLNVCPPTKLSHRDERGAIHGPHEHFGDMVHAVTDGSVQCGAVQAAFNLFCSRINLAFSGSLNAPL